MKKEILTFSVALLSAVLSAAMPTDVYLLIGQSNMAGRGDVSVEKVDSSRLLKWGDAGGWVEATEPLYRDGETAGAGPVACRLISGRGAYCALTENMA